jgi:GT2 family glycosyltransferase
MDNPSVSVIIVNYNAGSLLSACVEAVLKSSVPLEVIVSDNGSTDGSIDHLLCINQDQDLRVVENGVNLGFAAGNNQVLPYARGEWILFLNPDCQIELDTIEKVQRAMMARPEVGIGGCMIKNPDSTEQEGTRRDIPTPWLALSRVLHLNRVFPEDSRFRDFNTDGTPLPKQPSNVEAISGAFMLVRGKALEDVGPMDDGYFLHCEDLDWFMRFQQAGWRVLFVPDAEATHVKGACSQAEPIRALWHKHRGMLRFYRKFYREKYPRPLMWAVTVAVWARFGLLGTGILLKRAVTR